MLLQVPTAHNPKTQTLWPLLAHSSGIADYFEGKSDDGIQLSKELMNNQDSAWTVTEIVDTVKQTMEPGFPPGAWGKALYSDTNFQLLGAIIEHITQKSLVDTINDRITTPLNLQNTYLYTQESTKQQLPVLALRFKENNVDIPMAMESVRLDGGIVSSSADSLIFIQAFMQRKLFNVIHLENMEQWNSIGFPLQAGVAVLKF